VKYLQLVLANLGRHKLRTILTILSVALALFLFASLRSVTTTLAATAQFGGARRLVTLNATGLVFPLPLAYGNRIKAMPGVTGLSWANWFGGKYGDGKRFFANFAVDAESYLKIYPEIVLPPEQRDAFLKDRTGALIGKRLLPQFGWKLGQNVTLQGTIFPGDWTFTVDGVYTPTDPAIGDDVLIFHHEYFDERIGRAGIRDGMSSKSTIRHTGPPSPKRSTTCSAIRARRPRRARSASSRRASRRCGGT